MKTKTFDCVQMKREAASRIYEETKNLSEQEEIEYWRKQDERFRRHREELLKQASEPKKHKP